MVAGTHLLSKSLALIGLLSTVTDAGLTPQPRNETAECPIKSVIGTDNTIAFSPLNMQDGKVWLDFEFEIGSMYCVKFDAVGVVNAKKCSMKDVATASPTTANPTPASHTTKAIVPTCRCEKGDAATGAKCLARYAESGITDGSVLEWCERCWALTGFDWLVKSWDGKEQWCHSSRPPPKCKCDNGVATTGTPCAAHFAKTGKELHYCASCYDPSSTLRLSETKDEQFCDKLF